MHPDLQLQGSPPLLFVQGRSKSPIPELGKVLLLSIDKLLIDMQMLGEKLHKANNIKHILIHLVN